MKLIVNSLIAVLLTVLVGVVGIFGMMQINASFTNMYDNQTVPMPYMTTIIEMLQRQRACMREYIIAAALGDMDLLEDAKSRTDGYNATFQEKAKAYEATISTATDAGKQAHQLDTEAMDLYNSSFVKCLDQIYDGAKTGISGGTAGKDLGDNLYAVMGQYTDDVNKFAEDLGKCMDLKVQVASDANDAGDKLFSTMLILIIIVLVVAIVVAMIFSTYISGIISKPLIALTGFMKKASTTGDLVFSRDEQNTIREYSLIRDEIGQCITATAAFVEHINSVSESLQKLADGDLTVKMNVLSDKDTIGVSMKATIDNLNNMFSEINTASSQVTMGASQIADGAQSLASGSTQQAATLEEISASISDISEKTKENAERTSNASNLASSIMQNAEKGSRQMEQMINAVNEINQANKNISQVIKAIDDIAFQTNILALNAAVEAARAGAAGKGFAVVAEEVRNLAAKSAESAKDTGSLIANSMEKAQLGTQIASETAASLSEIVSGIGESNQIIAQIAHASDEQYGSISQINSAIGGVTQVVQQNSATAEQSAAASEEMSGQAGVLEGLIAQFKLR
jgi:methyl-accepting chemotaxis protein